MDVVVPVKPLTKPAIPSRAGVDSNLLPIALIATASNTQTATSICSVKVEMLSKVQVPNMTPGIRVSIGTDICLSFNDARSSQQTLQVSGMLMMARMIGTQLGSINAITGALSKANPKPTAD